MSDTNEPDDDIIASINVCAGPPACKLEGDEAVENSQAGCPMCTVIDVHKDGTETTRRNKTN